MIPADGLAQIEDGKSGEDDQRDHLLDRLELRRGIDRVAVVIGRDSKAVLDERNAPARQDELPHRHLRESELAVPREGHEDVGNTQKQDRRDHWPSHECPLRSESMHNTPRKTPNRPWRGVANGRMLTAFT